MVYGNLAWSSLVEFVGAVVHADHWVLDTSVFFPMVPAPATAPATAPAWGSAGLMAGTGLAGALLGGVLFRRRDVVGS